MAVVKTEVCSQGWIFLRLSPIRIREKNSTTFFFNNYHKGKKFDQRGKNSTTREEIRPAGKKIRSAGKKIWPAGEKFATLPSHCWLEHVRNSKKMPTYVEHIFDTFEYF